ncbi:MAG: hypothetical protein ABJF50_25355 [Paracoccaceae bacterium]|uniref:hypothetical protein n=1 Tax=Hyphomonas sp. TaxID=87 RepID=UPI00326C5638
MARSDIQFGDGGVIHFGIRWAALAALAVGACGENALKEKEEQQLSEVREYVSKTPEAQIFDQTPRDPSIIWTDIDSKIALVDKLTGDTILAQVVDREQRLIYLAYVTREGKPVRVFTTQLGEDRHGVRWEKFPIRVWNGSEFEHSTDSIKEAGKRATLERLAQFISSWPDWEG